MRGGVYVGLIVAGMNKFEYINGRHIFILYILLFSQSYGIRVQECQPIHGFLKAIMGTYIYLQFFGCYFFNFILIEFH